MWRIIKSDVCLTQTGQPPASEHSGVLLVYALPPLELCRGPGTEHRSVGLQRSSGWPVSDPVFADDIAMLGSTCEAIQQTPIRINSQAHTVSLKVKTLQTRGDVALLDEVALESVDSQKNQGSLIATTAGKGGKLN